MDLHEWEILSDDGLLDYKDDQKKIVSAKRRSGSDAKIVFDMNYFLCPSMNSSSKQHISQPSSSRLVRQPIPVHLQLDSPIVKIPDDDSLALKEKEKEKESIVIGVVPSAMSEKDQKGAVEADQDTVTQVFFKKMKENEFVDMKLDSPRSSNKGTKPQIDVGHYQFDDGGESKENITNSPRMNLISQKSNKEIDANKDEMNWDGSMGGLNILKWSLNGIGAICSFGVAAATICILFHGGNQHKLRIQIYTHDKKLKQAVQQATRLNEAISAARGLPQTRAHITCGGHYGGL
ncbi:hypothetical protein IC582_019792 [Cucumis melo]|uniref:Uncharacterized protein LOC103485984 n=2 Tax=Cucumis melo TaxID=3656 RepID=A0A1S3B4M8_CUCME|nr:uncharacterized protein LOC103485984 [Cucumis melo]KAA0060102.1 uncharacterized protein E6C27_scaffold39G00200 [Cucumis melo var. makuwa]TYK08416.1 uncharacterized protein E5676_scaffold654G00300 [Cucumis melo var. makuwa]